MLCKKCEKLVERQYEQTGMCENCFANACGDVTDVYKDTPIPSTISKEKILELTISELGLSEKAENCLSNAGIIFVKALIKRTERELMNIPNLGAMTLNEIKEGLQKFNLMLKEENPSLVLSLQS